jgi:hypothetical protein
MGVLRAMFGGISRARRSYPKRIAKTSLRARDLPSMQKAAEVPPDDQGLRNDRQDRADCAFPPSSSGVEFHSPPRDADKGDEES